MSKIRLFLALLLVTALTAVMSAQTAQPMPKPAELKQTTTATQRPVQTQRSLGVALVMPNGTSIAYPIQPTDSTEESLAPITVPGASNVSAIRIFPHMTGEKVAVRVTAISTKQGKAAQASQPMGNYVIGEFGDSLKLNDLAKLGLPALEVKVVKARFAADSPDDPCCFTLDGPECCAPTVAILCSECGVACNLGCFAPSRKKSKLDIGLDAKRKTNTAAAEKQSK
jgi:hypothetical protein